MVFEKIVFKFLFSHKKVPNGVENVFLKIVQAVMEVLNKSQLWQLPLANEAKPHFSCRAFWAKSLLYLIWTNNTTEKYFA